MEFWLRRPGVVVVVAVAVARTVLVVRVVVLVASRAVASALLRRLKGWAGVRIPWTLYLII